MANHTNDVAYSPPHLQPAPSLDTLDSPIPSRATSIDADGLAEGPSTAGRKRKLNSMSSRGVANLNPDQLAKKRANDRQAQRAIRERTKGHIDALEQKVRDLSSQKPILDLQAALRQNEAIRAENAELRHGLKAAMDIIQPLMAKAELPGKLHAPNLVHVSQSNDCRGASDSRHTDIRFTTFTNIPLSRLGFLCFHRPGASSKRETICGILGQPRHTVPYSLCANTRESPQQYQRRSPRSLLPYCIRLPTP